MGFWNKIFGKSDAQKVGGMEDFMTLIRVIWALPIWLLFLTFVCSRLH